MFKAILYGSHVLGLAIASVACFMFNDPAATALFVGLSAISLINYYEDGR